MLRVYAFLIVMAFNLQPKASGLIQSSSADRQDVEVTVYNSNLGLIKEKRLISIPSGEGELRFMDVASLINPVSVHVKSLSDPGEFTVLEQNYEYDLMSHEKLLEKYIGKKIKIIDWNEFQDRKEVVEAELLSADGGEIYKIGDEIFLGHPGYKVLPEVPSNLISRPTLSWNYRNKVKRRNHQIEVSYLTAGISWNADYVLLVPSSGGKGEISGWVTVENRSGALFENAQLKLVAGDLNRVHELPVNELRMGRTMDSQMSKPEFSQENLFEYHIYDLQRRTTIKNNQTKQIKLLEAGGVKLFKEYITVAPQNHYWGRRIDGQVKQPVQVNLKFSNDKQNNLAMPIPAGTVRIYTVDSKGKQQFIGEDRVDHTPKNEKITLKTGNAFDIVAERVQNDFSQKTSQLYETDWTVTIRNRKDEKITLGVVEKAQGNWEVVDSSHKYKKVDASSFRFDVTVPANGETEVSYKLRVGI